MALAHLVLNRLGNVSGNRWSETLLDLIFGLVSYKLAVDLLYILKRGFDRIHVRVSHHNDSYTASVPDFQDILAKAI